MSLVTKPYTEVSSMQINHNIRAMVTQHALFQNNNAMTKSLEKLSTGLRINRAQDDAAGLAMSEQMRTQIRGLGKAKQNSQDGQAALQIAEGSLAEITNMMQRQKELAVQSANDTLTSTERFYLNDEFQALTKEINRIANNTDYNGKNVLLFDRDSNKSFGATKLNPYNKEVSFLDAAKTLYDTFGSKLDGGLSGIGMLNSDLQTYTTDANGLDKVKTAITEINSIISNFSSVGINENNISEVLQRILAHDITIPAASSKSGDAIKLSGDAIFADVTNVSDLNGAKLTDADKTAIKEVNAFLRNVQTAYEALMSSKVGDTKGKVLEAAENDMANALSRLFQTDSEYITKDTGNATTHVDGTNLLTIAGAGNYSSLADAANLVIGYLGNVGTGGKGLTLSQNFSIETFPDVSKNALFADSKDALAVMDTLFNGKESKAAIDAVLAFDVSKMKDNDGKLLKDEDRNGNKNSQYQAYIQATALQKTLSELSAAYKNYSEEKVAPVGEAASEILHVGPNYSTGLGGAASNQIKVNYTAIDVKGLGLEAQTIDSQEGAQRAIDRLQNTIKVVSGNRAAIGTYINRLDYTINNIASMEYNIQDAESRIRDTDFAKETTDFTKNQIMVQASTSMLSQANSLPQAVLGLLG